jgi:hypothetical protein
MAAFIKIGKNYNPITLQGEGEKIINPEFIIHVTDWSEMENKVRAGVKSRIYLSTGEYIDTVESYDGIIEKLEKVGSTISK